MKQALSFIMVVALVAGALVLNQGCGTTSATTDISTKHTASYVGTGSVWTWNLNVDGTFTAKKKQLSTSVQNALEITGTYETYSTGFYNFTVGTATSPDGSESSSLPTVGTVAPGFGVPGVVLLVKSGDNKVLAMPVVSTACPTTDTLFNWVKASPGAYSAVADLSTEDLYGNATLPAAAGTISGNKFLLDGTVTAVPSLTTHTGCSSGMFSLADGFINMTSAGVGIVKAGNSTNANDIVALPRDTSVSLDTMRSKNFVALVFSRSGASTPEIKPMNLTFPASGAGTYTQLSDIATGTAGQTGSLNLVEAGAGEKAGFIKMTATGGSGKTPTMWAAVVANLNGSGRTFFFASGGNVPDGGGAVNDPFAVIGIQK